MQDGRALQAGTSHYLGQNFARAFGTEFQTKDGNLDFVHQTSWGVSTRLVGALIMAHSDDKGLVIPPRLAPIHVVIIPIGKGDGREAVVKHSKMLADKIRSWPAQKAGLGGPIAVVVDDDDTKSPGWKFNEWEVKGVPIRIELGPKDLAKDQAVLARRDIGEKEAVALNDVAAKVVDLLASVQESLYARAVKFREDHTTDVESYDEFKAVLDKKGGFVRAHWDGTAETEAAIKEETKATIRCIPLDAAEEEGVCIKTRAPSKRKILFARAY